MSLQINNNEYMHVLRRKEKDSDNGRRGAKTRTHSRKVRDANPLKKDGISNKKECTRRGKTQQAKHTTKVEHPVAEKKTQASWAQHT